LLQQTGWQQTMAYENVLASYEEGPCEDIPVMVICGCEEGKLAALKFV